MRQEIVENVNIIINSAASVDFNSPIKVALEINYYGVQKVLELAEECKNLENFVHVSTAYVNSDKLG
jgi:thioester reductase-like protein